MKKMTMIILSIILSLGCIVFNPIPYGNAVNAADNSNILVVYFSCTGTTEGAAKNIQNTLGADIYKIEPSEPYSSEDLNYNNNSSRANIEQSDSNARPSISGSIENLNKYDAIFLGYPIWHGKAPKIIYTFLESYNFSDKTIIPFCTSGGSGISGSESELHKLAENASWIEGRRLSGSDSETSIKNWLDTIDLPEAETVQTPAPSSAPAAVPEVTIENNIVTVKNAPENSTLILAFYKDNVLINVDITEGSGTITENISDKSSDADLIKAFLWDMKTINPLYSAKQIENNKNQEMQIKVVSGEYEIIYKLNGSQAAKELYAQLPLTIEVEDFSTNEKVFYPPQKLSIIDTPMASGGKGKLAYFEPWGDVVMFYDSFSENSSLFELGEVVSGQDDIEMLSGIITISAYDI